MGSKLRHANSPGTQENKIFGAALDSLDQIPPTTENPLLQQTNCLITPQIATATYKTRLRIAQAAIDNALAGLFDDLFISSRGPPAYSQVPDSPGASPTSLGPTPKREPRPKWLPEGTFVPASSPSAFHEARELSLRSPRSSASPARAKPPGLLD